MVFKFINALEGFLWDKAGLILLAACGIYFSIRCRFFQIFKIKLWLFETVAGISAKGEHAGLSPFGAFCTALAATIGVGNIAGVASAIILGGPGAVFWMLAAAFLGMATSLFENTLGHFFRRKNSRGETVGGAMYYIRDRVGAFRGMKKTAKFLSYLFAALCTAAAFGIGNMAQINVITKNIASSLGGSYRVFGVELVPAVAGVLLCLLAGAVIKGGRERSTKITSKLVPPMVLFFILSSIIIIAQNYEKLLPAVRSVLVHAFSKKAAGGGAAGSLLRVSLQNGFKRGVFSNEAGMGSATIVNSAADTDEPVKQGMLGMFEVFIDTVVMCSLTALLILCSGFVDLESGRCITSGDGATLINEIYKTAFGAAGSVFISATIFLFAFSTVIGWSYFGSVAAEFIFGEKGGELFRAIFIGFIPFGAVIPFSFALRLCDISNALMLFPNLFGVLLLSPLASKIIKNYTYRKKGKIILPLRSFADFSCK